MVGETDGIAVGPEVVGDVKVTEWSPGWHAVLMAMWSGPMVGDIVGDAVGSEMVSDTDGDRVRSDSVGSVVG